MIRAHRWITLHRYFLNASRNNALFERELTENRADHPHAMIHLLLWYGCLFVVVEGYAEEKLTDPNVDVLVGDTAKLDLLRRCRNATFHYANQYLDPRVEAVLVEPGFVAWVRELHESLGAFFLSDDPP